MINFEEELKSFQPCLEMEEVEESVHKQEFSDLVELLGMRVQISGDLAGEDSE